MTDFTKLKCAHLADGKIVAGVAGVHGETIVRNLATGTPENFSGSATHETPLHFRAPARAQLLYRREKTEFSSADLNGGDRVKASSADLAKTALTRIRRMTKDFAVQFRHLWHNFQKVILD